MSADRRPSTVDRFLRVFTDVHAGESATALLLALNVFLLMTAYAVLKTIRESLIEHAGGEVRSYAAAGQALLLVGAVPLYALLAGKLPRRRLINIVTTFFVVCIAVFYAMAKAGAAVGVVFFLWLGIFNLMIIAQFWSFANDLYTTDEGKRLFPIVAFGMSLGAVVGSVLVGKLIQPLGVYLPMLVAAAILLLALVVTNGVDARERRRTESGRAVGESTAAMPAATRELRLESGEFKLADVRRAVRPGAPGPDPDAARARGVGAGADAFRLVARNRYLLLIALMILFANWVNTTGEYILYHTVEGMARRAEAAGPAGGVDPKAFVGIFYSKFYLGVNLAGLLLQLFAVSRILKFAGVRIAVLILPLIAFIGYGSLAFLPLLGVIRWAKTAENATDYSLQNTVRNVLFLPTTREEKYKAKQAIDSFFVRAGDVLSAGLVWAGIHVLQFQASQFAIVNLALVAVWIVLAVWVGREFRRASSAVAA